MNEILEEDKTLGFTFSTLSPPDVSLLSGDVSCFRGTVCWSKHLVWTCTFWALTCSIPSIPGVANQSRGYCVTAKIHMIYMGACQMHHLLKMTFRTFLICIDTHRHEVDIRKKHTNIRPCLLCTLWIILLHFTTYFTAFSRAVREMFVKQEAQTPDWRAGCGTPVLMQLT